MQTEAQANAYRKLIEVGISLSSDEDLDTLLVHILEEAKAFSGADAGTIYLVSGDDLQFTIVLNDTLDARASENWKQIAFPRIPLREKDGTANERNIASCTVHRGVTILINDAREDTEFDFSGTQEIDCMLDYETTSILSIPMRSADGMPIGVLQLLNAKDDDGTCVPFSDEAMPLMEALASLASVAIHNRILLDEQVDLKRQLEREVDSRTEELKDALTKLSEAHIILKELNTIDAVTGIRNRQYFDDVLEQEWRRASRQNYEISLLLLDLDHFKNVNDTYGHLAGDETLAAVAKEVDSMFNRPSDVVARYGGEEFAVVLPYVEADNAMHLAEQLRQLIESKTFNADGHELGVTMSIGVATVSPSKQCEPRDLIGWADGSLYKAKSTGRNQVVQHQR